MNAAERRKRKFKQNIYQLAMFSFVVAIIWIVFEIYYSYFQTDTQTDVTSSQLEPIDRSLYLDLANKLADRENLTDEQLNNIAVATPSATVEIDLDLLNQIASPSSSSVAESE